MSGVGQRIELYEPYARPLPALVRVLKGLGLDGGRVGFEKDAMPSALHWEEIQGGLPRLTMVDCATMMEEVRWIKTPGEIALLRRAADLLDDAYAEVFPTIRPGESEREVHSRIVASCLRRGVRLGARHPQHEPNPILYGGEGDARFQQATSSERTTSPTSTATPGTSRAWRSSARPPTSNAAATR